MRISAFVSCLLAVFAFQSFSAPSTADAGDRCCPKKCCRCEIKDFVKKLRGPEPPRAAVVASVPAVMIAQQAVAVSPQVIQESLVRRHEDAAAKRLLEVVEKLEARTQAQAGAQAQAQAQARSAKDYDRRLNELEEKVERLTDNLSDVVEILKAQNAGR